MARAGSILIENQNIFFPEAQSAGRADAWVRPYGILFIVYMEDDMGGNVLITIDGRKIFAFEGEKLLFAALRHGIYIPHLCAIEEEARPAASCRLCFVEIEGIEAPVTACNQPVWAGMAVQTRSLAVDRLVKSAFELIMSAHRLDCGECSKNDNCALREIAVERGLKLKGSRLTPLMTDFPPKDESLHSFVFDPGRCVLCGRCVWVDRYIAKVGAIGYCGRSYQRRISAFAGRPLAESSCTECGLCVEVCPVGALYLKGNL